MQWVATVMREVIRLRVSFGGGGPADGLDVGTRPMPKVTLPISGRAGTQMQG